MTYIFSSYILPYVNILQDNAMYVHNTFGVMFDPKMNVSHFDLCIFNSSVIFFKTKGYMNIMLSYYEAVRPNVLPQNKFRSL